MRRALVVGGFSVSAFACMLAPCLRADLVSDQSSIPPSPPTFVAGVEYIPGFPTILSTAQTFTVGLDGQLAQIDVFVGNLDDTAVSSPLTLRVLATDVDGAPDSFTALGTQTLPAAAVPYVQGGFVSFSLPPLPSLQVHVGEVLAIELSAGSSGYGDYRWEGAAPANYAGGSSFQQIDDAGPWFDTSPVEGTEGFRTWVALPEPSSAFSILGARLLLRRRW